ncbi:MAG: SDR family oxidoreductase [Bacteriovoracaceae bacterium]|jgi:enoyl-[acyl-carrier protein] reductase I|nr:SDR family oxidoreductase [Bacteriovoracaceae bacterium]
MDFLKVVDKIFLITGVSNKKSVAFHTARTLKNNGAKLIFTVQSNEHVKRVEKLFPDEKVYLLNVEDEEAIRNFGLKLRSDNISLAGMLHSIAFANYSDGIKPFHETVYKDYVQASQISVFSLIAISNAIKPCLKNDASVVTVSISNTRATNYGYMGPLKAALDSSVAFLAKSFSKDSKVRFNAVCSGPLKTSASAGIPGYVNNYLYAEKLTLRQEALSTSEVADSICYLLSPRSSGINATGLLIDAGMSCNYFDEDIVNTIADNL